MHQRNEASRKSELQNDFLELWPKHRQRFVKHGPVYHWRDFSPPLVSWTLPRNTLHQSNRDWCHQHWRFSPTSRNAFTHLWSIHMSHSSTRCSVAGSSSGRRAPNSGLFCFFLVNVAFVTFDKVEKIKIWPFSGETGPAAFYWRPALQREGGLVFSVYTPQLYILKETFVRRRRRRR